MNVAWNVDLLKLLLIYVLPEFFENEFYAQSFMPKKLMWNIYENFLIVLSQ